MSIPTIRIDLSLPPARRWDALRPYADQARALFRVYLNDLSGLTDLREQLAVYQAVLLSRSMTEEMRAVAGMAGVEPLDALAVNLTYDLTKYLWGCTAFAVDTPSGPIHARNLDWWNELGLLSAYTAVLDYRNGPRGPFQVIGWPGFIGALSGVAEGRFAVTLNAVSSADPPQIAPPITFLLRDVFETAADYAEAVRRLSEAPIPGDCLLLVSGTKPGELAVIERTPARSVFRAAEGGRVIVTNHYRRLDIPQDLASEGELAATSCGRYDRAQELLDRLPSFDDEKCLAILRDSQIQMGITVQQMIFSAAQGRCRVELPQ